MQRIEREKYPIIVNISNRHFHCRQETFEKLFGKGAQPTKLRDLVQPGQFACQETITIKGPRGEIQKVRMIGPVRAYDQVEVSKTDSLKLGINPPVRDSGNLKGSSPITLVGTKGEVALPEGAIIALRHIHMHPSETEKYGVKNMDIVQIRIGRAPREGVLSILCRVAENMKLECHIDTDEGNALDVHNGDTVIML